MEKHWGEGTEHGNMDSGFLEQDTCFFQKKCQLRGELMPATCQAGVSLVLTTDSHRPSAG